MVEYQVHLEKFNLARINDYASEQPTCIESFDGHSMSAVNYQQNLIVTYGRKEPDQGVTVTQVFYDPSGAQQTIGHLTRYVDQSLRAISTQVVYKNRHYTIVGMADSNPKQINLSVFKTSPQPGSIVKLDPIVHVEYEFGGQAGRKEINAAVVTIDEVERIFLYETISDDTRITTFLRISLPEETAEGFPQFSKSLRVVVTDVHDNTVLPVAAIDGRVYMVYTAKDGTPWLRILDADKVDINEFIRLPDGTILDGRWRGLGLAAFRGLLYYVGCFKEEMIPRIIPYDPETRKWGAIVPKSRKYLPNASAVVAHMNQLKIVCPFEL